MAQPAVLIVDDEAPIRRAVRHAVEREANRILEATSGREAIDLVAAQRPDIVVLDLGLPDLDGAAVCREIRGWSDAAIIVLSARHSDREKVELLELGADDYVTKPFSPDELRARVRVQLRRRASRGGEAPDEIRMDDVVIDLAKRSVIRDGTRVHLTPIEWELLRALLAHRGRTMTHAQLYSAVWNQSFGDPQHHLRVHVANLRRKLERDTIHPRLIVTEPGVGYRFADDE
jgi:two-component system KDP operon response regulator KdpE